MTLSPMGGDVHLHDGGAVFNMRNGTEVVLVQVSQSAVQWLAGSKRRPYYTSIVQKWRYRIEALAVCKYEGRPVERDGSVLIDRSDLS